KAIIKVISYASRCLYHQVFNYLKPSLLGVPTVVQLVKDLALSLQLLSLCCGLNWIPSSGTSTCHECGQKFFLKKVFSTEKTMTLKDTCTPMFTAALFAIAKTWKQPKCPLTEEWIKMWYIYTTEYYSAIKRNKIMAFFSNMDGPRNYHAK
uniref:Uncharacterized protein n=1 Tax=Sus scrofa TaxID=9823 RepID=A0A8D1LIF9_PIG